MYDIISTSIIKVLREFGPVGVATYVGGIILLARFLSEENLQKQFLLGGVGVVLIAFSIYIAYFRLRIQRDKELELIRMAASTNNRLAEQIGKDMNEEQISTITQKIRQTQRDLMHVVAGKEIKQES